MNKLLILCGIPFSGKTTLSHKLVNKLGLSKIDLDDIKFELFGRNIKDSQLEQLDWDRVYKEMYRRIEFILKQGKIVIHDTGNFTKHERNLVRTIANKLDIEALTIFVNTPVSIARQRLIENRNNSKRFDITDEEFENAVNEMEPPDDLERHITVDTDISVHDLEKMLELGE